MGHNREKYVKFPFKNKTVKSKHHFVEMWLPLTFEIL